MFQAQITSIEKGRVIAEMKLSKEHCNILNTLHGGLSATLVDHFTSLTLISHFYAEGKEPPDSASIELSMSYLSAIPEGREIRIEAENLRVGRKLAFLSAKIYDKQSRKLSVSGKHTKFIL